MSQSQPELNLNTDRVRSLLAQLYDQCDNFVPDSHLVDADEAPGFGAFLAALDDATTALSQRASALAQDGSALADVVTRHLHTVENIDGQAGHRFDSTME